MMSMRYAACYYLPVVSLAACITWNVASGIEDNAWGVSIPRSSPTIRLGGSRSSLGSGLLTPDVDQEEVKEISKARIEADDWLNKIEFGEHSVNPFDHDAADEIFQRPDPYPELRLHLNTENPERRHPQSNGIRNNDLFQDQESSLLHTGTTIAGCCCRVDGHDGPSAVVLAADSRATSSTTVADTKCEKIHRLAPNIYACGAGTSGDLDHLTRQCHYTHALMSMTRSTIGNRDSSDAEGDQVTTTSGLSLPSHVHSIREQIPAKVLNRSPSVESICGWFQRQLYKGRGQIGANLIVGGVDENGRASLSAIHPHGSRDIDLPFAALGSGGMAALGVLERGFDGLSAASLPTIEEGIKMVTQAIIAGIRNDLGSGSHVDLCIVYPDGRSEYRRSTVPEEHIQEDELVGASPTSSTTPVGVNGFGNAPMLVGPRELRVEPTAATAKNAEKRWDDILGL